MKTYLISLLLLIAAFTSGQTTQKSNLSGNESLKKSAETFVATYIKNFETKNWDAILNSASPTGILYSSLSTYPLHERVKFIVDYYRNNQIEAKVDIKSFSTNLFGQNSALVTVRYLETDKIKEKNSYFDFLENYLLTRNKGEWKISKLFTEYTQPIIFNSSVDKKYQTPIVEPYDKFEGSLGQMGSASVFFFDEFKKNGVSTAELGKKAGNFYTKYWNNTKGFNGLTRGFLRGMQTLSTYIEVLEYNDNILKMKCFNNVKPNKDLSITSKEILDYYQNAFSRIADHMGGKCMMTEDGDFFLITFTKQ